MKEKWKSMRLGECFNIKHGWAFKGKFFAKEGKFILLTPGNFNPDGGIKHKGDKEKYYAGDFPTDFLLKFGDFLVVMTDLTQDAPILGSPAFVKENDKFLHNQRLGKIVDLDQTEMDRSFLYYLFNFPSVRNQIKASATGATVKHTAPDRIYNVAVDLPPLPTQRKIAAVLSAYDDLIENNTRRIKILEEMASAIYREWFVKFRFPGHEQVPMVESELGLIPQGWEVGELGDLAESVRRNIKQSDINQETPYLGLEHLPRKSIALSNWDSVDSINSAKLAFKKGEILFGKIRPYFHKVGVAPLDGICSSDTIVIRPKRNECFATTLSYVSSEHFIEYATITSQGTKMPRADWKVLVKYPVIIPPEQITQRFSSFVRDVVDQIQNLIFQNRNLRQTRDLLLPKLISGEIDVSELDIDID